jgi:hypothetical protein
MNRDWSVSGRAVSVVYTFSERVPVLNLKRGREEIMGFETLLHNAAESSRQANFGRTVAAVLVGIGLLSTILGEPASASPLLLSSAETCIGTMAPGPSFCNLDQSIVQSGIGAFVAVSDSFGSGGKQLVGNAGAVAAFGLMGAQASAQFLLDSVGHAYASGVALFRDDITISFAPWNGLTGLLHMSYTLEGSSNESGDANAFARVDASVGPTSNPATGQSFGAVHQGTANGQFSAGTFQFVFGQPFGLQFSLSTQVGTVFPVGSGGTVCIACIGAGSGTALFLNTLTLTGFVPTDLNGTPAIGAAFSSASGTPYTVNGVAPVPEPATGLLLSAGLLGIARRYMRQKRSRRRP